MADSVVELKVVPSASELREFKEAKEEGDRVQDEFILHSMDAGWTVLDFTAESKRFRDKRGAPIAVNNDGDIKLPDYGISKQPYYPATTLPSLYCEIKGKTPYTHKDGQRYYYYDDWRWDYFKEFCHQTGNAGLLVFKYGVRVKKENSDDEYWDYSGIDLDRIYCASLEHLEKNIAGVRKGHKARNGKQSWCVLFPFEAFIPLKDFLYGEIISPIRHPLMLKQNNEWVGV
mgnify:FL=1